MEDSAAEPDSADIVYDVGRSVEPDRVAAVDRCIADAHTAPEDD